MVITEAMADTETTPRVNLEAKEDMEDTEATVVEVGLTIVMRMMKKKKFLIINFKYRKNYKMIQKF